MVNYKCSIVNKMRFLLYGYLVNGQYFYRLSKFNGLSKYTYETTASNIREPVGVVSNMASTRICAGSRITDHAAEIHLASKVNSG